jgi:hypothetical protein
MQESEEENHDLPQKSKPLEENGFSMDFDIDFENSWPLDHLSNTMYPFLLSTTSEQQHFSPIWTFSDAEDDSIAASGFFLIFYFVIFVFFVLFQFGLRIWFFFFLILFV